MKLKSLFSRYIRDQGGHFAVWTALMGLPLIAVTGYAIDNNQAVSANLKLKHALDSAALASVVPANMSPKEREAYAEEVFYENYHMDESVKLDVKATRDQVSIAGKLQIPTMFGSVYKHDHQDISEKSTAELTRSDVVCVLALDPTGAKALEFSDNAKFSAPACSVQSNSTHETALVSNSSSAPKAMSFCSAGLSQGSFKPYAKNACTPIEDPYKDLPAPEFGYCNDLPSHFRGNNRSEQSLDDIEERMQGSGDVEIISDDVVLRPGVFCDGLKIEGRNVRFRPGTYTVYGTMEFTQYAGAVGKDVTFVLKGAFSRLIIRDGAQVRLKAPKNGNYAGIVFFQDPMIDFYQTIGGFDITKYFPTDRSEISSGGGLNIVGTAYFPGQELFITSEKTVASRSPATSFIAYRLKFGGKSDLHVKVDHEAGGIPPIKPRSDDSARLVE